MIARILAGTIVCLLCFNAGVVKYFDSEMFIKATIGALIIGPILGYLSYKGKKAAEEKPIEKKSKRKSSK